MIHNDNIKILHCGLDTLAGSVLSSFGKILGVFNPALGSPVALAGSVLENFANIDDNVAKNDIIGISSSCIILDDVIKKLRAGENIDIKSLEILSENLKALDVSLDKFYKIIS